MTTLRFVKAFFSLLLTGFVCLPVLADAATIVGRSTYRKEFGQRLKAIRNRNELTQTEFGERLELTSHDSPIRSGDEAAKLASSQAHCRSV